MEKRKIYFGGFQQLGKAQCNIENSTGIQDDKISLQSQNREEDCHQGNAQGSIQCIVEQRADLLVKAF